MSRLSRRLLREWLELLLNTHDTPQRTTAAGAAPGVAADVLAVPAIVAGRTHIHLPHRHRHQTDAR